MLDSGMKTPNRIIFILFAFYVVADIVFFGATFFSERIAPYRNYFHVVILVGVLIGYFGYVYRRPIGRRWFWLSVGFALIGHYGNEAYRAFGVWRSLDYSINGHIVMLTLILHVLLVPAAWGLFRYVFFSDQLWKAPVGNANE